MDQQEKVRLLREHMQKEHNISPISVYLKEVIYGGIDGIITTFAVVAGFTGAALSGDAVTELSFMVVMLFGLANLFADGVSMGLGNFLSVRSEQSRYCSIYAKEWEEIEKNPQLEADETAVILIQKGFSEQDARTLTDIYRKNERYWTDFMMSHELKIPDPTDEHPVYTGLATFSAFIFFGIVPLIPFIFMNEINPQSAFYVSASGGLIALILLGFLKARVIGHKIWEAIGEVVLIGAVAASVAFLVGTFFHM